jgi:hypothetical protein
MCGAKRLMVHVVIGFGTAARDMLSKVHVKAGSLGESVSKLSWYGTRDHGGTPMIPCRRSAL